MKSPETSVEGVKPGNELDFIERNLRRTSHQFRDRGLGSARVVPNLRYRHAASDDVLIRETKRRMAMHDVAEVLFIKSDGSLERLYKRKPPSVSSRPMEAFADQILARAISSTAERRILAPETEVRQLGGKPS